MENKQLLFELAKEITYRLRLAPLHLSVNNEMDCLGKYYPKTNLIEINIEKHAYEKEGELLKTLFHELGHYIQYYKYYRGCYWQVTRGQRNPDFVGSF